MRHVDLCEVSDRWSITDANSYLLVTFHQLKSLAFDILLATNDIGKYWRQLSSLKLRRSYLQIEVSRVFVFKVKPNIVFIFKTSVVMVELKLYLNSRLNSVQC